MRTPLLGAATVAVLAAGALATTGVFGSSHREAPRIMLDPSADNTDVYAFVAPDAPGKLTVVSNWIPLAEPGGRPVLREARSGRALLRQDRQQRRRRRGRRVSLAVQEPLPEPELVPVRGPAGQLDQRPEPQLRPDVRPVLRDATTARVVSTTTGRSRTTCRSRPTTSGRRRCPTTRRSPTARSATRRGGGKTFVGPADDAFFVDLGAVFDGINIDKPGRPAIGLGNQGGGKDDVSGYNAHSFVLQVPTSEVDARRPAGQRARRRATRSSACGRPPSAARSRSTSSGNAQGRVGPGQPPRQPADQRGDHPDRPEGQVQRHRPGDRRQELRRRRDQPGAGQDPERAVQPRDQGERPHGHRPGAADRRSRPDADLAATRCPPTR